MATVEAPVSDGRTRRSPVAFGPFTFDADNGLLRKDGRELPLPPRVLGVLALLLERAGDLVPRQQIIERVWKDAFVTDTSLAEAVSGLRQALGDDPQTPTYIQTVHRRGYRFVAAVELLQPSIPPAPAAPATVPVQAMPAAAPVVVSPSIAGQLVPWSAAALCTVLAIAAVWQLTSRREQVPVEARFTLGLPAGWTFETSGPAVALSPDGSTAVWSACNSEGCRLYVRPLSQLEATPLRGTERASSPFFSPDGRSVAFFADGRLKRLALSGGAPGAIADVTLPRGGVWTGDGRIIFGSGLAAGLWQVPASGGTPQSLTTPNGVDGEVRHAWPALIGGDGRTLAFTIDATLDDEAPGRLGLATLEGPTRLTSWATVLQNVRNARAIAPDLLVVSRGNELQAVGVDSSRRALTGLPQSLVSQVSTAGGAAQFATSGAGSLLHVSQGAPQGAGGLTWWSASGEAALPSSLMPATLVSLAADGRRLAWTATEDSDRADIWVGDVERGASARVTHEQRNTSPVWSPDGRVFFARAVDGRFRIATTTADGGAITIGAGADRHLFPAAVSGDGRTVAIVAAGSDTRADIWLMPSSGGEPRAVVQSPFDEVSPALSSDGSLLAYQSDESGRWDVHVLRIGDNRRALASTSGGERPFWGADGRALFYQAAGLLWRVDVGPDVTIGQPLRVLDLKGRVAIAQARDGRILLQQLRTSTTSTAVVALQWDREARRLLGPPTATLPR